MKTTKGEASGGYQNSRSPLKVGAKMNVLAGQPR